MNFNNHLSSLRQSSHSLFIILFSVPILCLVSFGRRTARNKSLERSSLKGPGEKRTVVPHPFGLHPETSWLDEWSCFVFFSFLRVQKYSSLEPCATDATLAFLEVFRRKLSLAVPWILIWQVHLLNRSRKRHGESDILPRKATVHRNHRILYKWNILRDDDNVNVDVSLDENEPTNSYIEATVYASVNLLPKDDDDSETPISLHDIQFHKHCHIIVWFPGGGMISLSHDEKPLALLHSLSNFQRASESAAQSDIVMIVPEYRLAPEHPFPAAVVDVLSVLSSVLEAVPNDVKIHIGGISAGGNLAAVCLGETHRRYPGRVKSGCVWDPMLDPACDSRSFYMNSRSSHFYLWPQWGWRAYLQLHENNQNNYPKNNNKTPNPPQTYQEFVATDSNREVLRQSPLYKTPLWGRLVHPLSEENLTNVDPDVFPTLIWTTSKADPLYDEGRLISEQLKMKGIRVTYLEARCSHILGFVMDKTFTLEFLEAWNRNVFT